jgi:RNA-binding protein
MIGAVMDEKLKQLRSEGTLLKPKFILGKNGLTEHVISNIKLALKDERLVKIKMLPSYIGDKDKNDLVSEILEKTNSKLVQFIGFTVVLTRK